MRWNCPHCSVALTIAEDSLNTGWSYAKCYNCAGFAMVRRTDLNPLKGPQTASGIKPQVRPAAPRKQIPSPPTFLLSSTDHKPKGPTPKPRQTPVPPPFKAPPPIQTALPKIPEVRGVNVTMTNRPAFREKFLPVAMGLAGVMAISSGVYLYIQGQQIWEKAMATPIKPVIETQLAINPVPQAATNLAADFSDQLHQKAMAPSRPGVPVSESSDSKFFVKVRTDKAILRTGPGTETAVFGFAKTETQLQVTDWKDRWFKVAVVKGDEVNYAWIRNDLVNPVNDLRTESSELSP